MAASTTRRATLDDLCQIDGKAELVRGAIVRYPELGHLALTAAEEIFISLRLHAKRMRQGIAHPGGVIYAMGEMASGRETFSPDASWFTGEMPARSVRFLNASPTFAVEVRHEREYSIDAEAEMAAKRADYFLAGACVVWEVDPFTETVTVYRNGESRKPAIFQRGERADAEPAVPGWCMLVDEIFLG